MRFDVEGKPDSLEPNGCLLIHAQRAAEVEIALGPHNALGQRNAKRRSHGLQVTPAQATSASSSMSPEHSSSPLPPVAGCRPATLSARPVSTLQAMA